ncbi:MAG: CDP-alcohol phosphatidyltransferase family protein [Clostridia bacterium]|nr:CDP-alcohol phosphatidyltransferase family protein [Clostridia bacterium]
MERLKFVWNIPNTLSLVRIVLLPVFAVLYFNEHVVWAVVVLLLSGLTDLLDGVIARRFHQITEVGKLLDPAADKLTQVTVLMCLVVQYPALIPLAVICLTKEILQAIGGWILFSKNATIRGSKWFGKLSTALFYAVMLLIVVWTDMPKTVLIVLVALVAATMLFSFFKYMMIYLKIRKPSKDEQAVSAEAKQN